MHQSTPEPEGMPEVQGDPAFGSSPEPIYCHPNLPDERKSEAPAGESSEFPGADEFSSPAFDAWWTSSQANDFNPFGGLEGIPKPSFCASRNRGPSSHHSNGRRGRSSSPHAASLKAEWSQAELPCGSQPDPDNLMVRIEQKYVGYIVGTSGSTIKRVSQQMNVKMHFDQKTYEQGYSTLHIVGMPEAVQRAKAEIENIMTQYNARVRREESRSVGARSRSPSVTSCGTANRRSASKCSQVSGSTSFQGSDYEASATVLVEAKFMGLVIGRQGSSLEEIKREYEVWIDIKNPRTNEGRGRFCIFGDADSVKQAKARILQIVKMYGEGDDKYIQRGRLRECASSDSSRAASPASWSGSDNGSRSGTGIGWENTKSQWRSKRGGWSYASNAPWAPCGNLRAKLKYLIGRWYCNQQCFEVQVDSRGHLSCTSSRLNESDEVGSRQPRPIYYEGRDIFLGERCRYFLNSLSSAYATWEDEQRPGIKLRWSSWKSLKTPSRGVGQVGTGKAPCPWKSYTGYTHSSTSKEAFRMTASDFPALG